MSGTVQTYWQFACRGAAPNQLTPPAKPLPFGYERHAVTLLVDSKIATVAKYYRVGVLAVAVVANGAFGILLFALTSWLTIDCGRTTRTGSMCLRRFRIRLRDAFRSVS
jgi:hypothetical protein